MLELAQLKDLDEIMIVIEEVKKLYLAEKIGVWKENYPKIESVMQEIEENRIYIWRENNHIVGSLMFATDKEDPHYDDIKEEKKDNYALIHRFTVRPEYQKHEVGRHMLEAIEQVAKQKGIQYLKTAMIPSDRYSCIMLERFGFVRQGETEGMDQAKRITYEKQIK